MHLNRILLRDYVQLCMCYGPVVKVICTNMGAVSINGRGPRAEDGDWGRGTESRPHHLGLATLAFNPPDGEVPHIISS